MGRFSFTRAAFRSRFESFKRRTMNPEISNDSTILEGKPHIKCHPNDTEWIRKQFERKDFMDKLSDATIVAGTLDIFGKLYGAVKYFSEHSLKDTAKAALKQFEFRTSDWKKSEAAGEGEDGKTESQLSQPIVPSKKILSQPTADDSTEILQALYGGTVPWIVALLQKLQVEVPTSPPKPNSEAKDDGAAPREVDTEKKGGRSGDNEKPGGDGGDGDGFGDGGDGDGFGDNDF